MSELAKLAEWTVPPNEIDQLGHMNISFYERRAVQGAERLLELSGAGPAELAAQGLKLAVVDRHARYRREQLQGAPLNLAGGVLAASPKRFDVYLEMSNPAQGAMASDFQLGVELQDRAARTAAPIPPPWLAAAEGWRIEPPPRHRPLRLTVERTGRNVTAADFLRVGLASHNRREITAEACDEDGYVTPKPFAREGVRTRAGVTENMWFALAGYAWPSLEMRTLLFRTARVGDVLEAYEAILHVGHKTLQWGVWVFEAKSGALVSITQQFNIFFNLTARRAEDMPSDLRERLTALATPHLFVGH
jgi:acyl-CoA thioester hydrolase